VLSVVLYIVVPVIVAQLCLGSRSRDTRVGSAV
jgi:hypothetical protein